jgi:hypothetical protein
MTRFAGYRGALMANARPAPNSAGTAPSAPDSIGPPLADVAVFISSCPRYPRPLRGVDNKCHVVLDRNFAMRAGRQASRSKPRW